MLDAMTAIGVSTLWLSKVLLLSLRIGSVFLMTPLLAPASVPASVRVLLILGLSAALSLGLPNVAASNPGIDGVGMLVQAGLTELAFGATLAVGILVAFSAFSVAGRLLDIQIGFGIGQVLGPSSNAQLPIITTAFNQIALLVFFLVNGHHALLRGLAYSLERFPLGQPWPLGAAFEPVLKQVAGLFALSFSLAAPVVFCILLVEMSLGVLARNLPQMNMLAMGIPVKIIVGMVALSLWFAGIGNVMLRVYSSIYQSWDLIFTAQAGAH